MQDVSTLGNSVWDCRLPVCCVCGLICSASSPNTTDGRTSPVGPDDLPPFASLTTDEDRERKAESRSPGTYNLVVNPESFLHLPEYSEEERLARRASIANSLASERECEADARSEDPNVVILRRFEDASRRSQRKDSPSPSTQTMPFRPTTQNPSSIQQAAEGGPDSNLLIYFRKHIWRQLAQIESAVPGQSQSGVEILEDAARYFPPVSPRVAFDVLTFDDLAFDLTLMTWLHSDSDSSSTP